MRDFRNIRRRIEFSLDKRQLISLLTGLGVGMLAVFFTGYYIGRLSQPSDNARLSAGYVPAGMDSASQEAQDTQPPKPASVFNKLTSHSKPVDPLLTETGEPHETEKTMVGTENLPSSKREKQREAKRIEPSKNTPTPDKKRRRRRKNTARVSSHANMPAGEFAQEIVPKGHYTIQLSAYQDIEEARAYVDGIKRRGLSPRIIQTQLADRGTWYRIRLGDFASELEANMYKARLGSLGIQAWVVRIP